MTEVQRLLNATIAQLNHDEKRDNRPRLSISFIRRYPGLFIAMYAGWLATLVVVLASHRLRNYAVPDHHRHPHRYRQFQNCRYRTLACRAQGCAS